MRSARTLDSAGAGLCLERFSNGRIAVSAVRDESAGVYWRDGASGLADGRFEVVD